MQRLRNPGSLHWVHAGDSDSLDDRVQVLQRAREALDAGAHAAAQLRVLRRRALRHRLELLLKVRLII